MNRKIILRLFLVLIGTGLITASVFAFQLGLDNNVAWGLRRFQMIGVGLALILFAVSYWVFPWFIGRFGQMLLPVESFFCALSFPRFFHWRFPKSGMRFQGVSRLFILVIPTVVLYIWILTAGQFFQWPSGRNYYHLLAQAFQQGQLHLLLEPSPELLALENPYDYRNRENVPHLWDASLYQGKYYLYWGLMPGLIGAVLESVFAIPVTDAGLVLGFLLAIALFGVLLLQKFCQNNNLPGWLFWFTALGLIFNVPGIWLLTRPSVYEASIAGGQAFSMAGLYFGYLALSGNTVSKRYLALAGLMLGLAGGTRTNLLVSTVAIALLTAGYLMLLHRRQLRDLFFSLVAMGLPLAVSIGILLGYNYVRFGSVFEFGHRYQLTGPALPANYEYVTSLAYISPNLFTYIFRLPAFSADFPYIKIPWIKEAMWPSFIRLPEYYYYTEPTAGILFIVPLLGFAGLLLIWILWNWVDGEISVIWKPKQLKLNPNLWFFSVLLVSVAIQFIVLLLFISSSLRYLFDVTPSLILLSVVFFSLQSDHFARYPYQKLFFIAGWVVCSILTVIFALLVGLTGATNHFENANPMLYNQLQAWFP